MESRTSVKVGVGLFVFAGLVLFAASIFLLGQRGRYFAPQHRLTAFFTDVAGLNEGATVRVAGVTVGRVTRVSLPRPPEQKVAVQLSVAGDAIESVRVDSVARVQTMGIMGDKFVEISVGSPGAPRLPEGATLLVADSDDLVALVAQGRRVLGHTERFTASLSEGRGALPWLIHDPESKRLLIETIGSVRTLTASIEHGQGALPWLIHDPDSRRLAQDLGRTAEVLAALATEVKEGRGLAHAMIYGPEGGRMLEEASETLRELQSLLVAVRTGDGALPALLFDPESRRLLESLTTASRHLEEISGKMARGEGTVGALLVDPTVYEDLTALLEGARRSWILRWAIRHTLESGRASRQETSSSAKP